MGLNFIAEAGVNHNGSFDEALRLISAAKDSGADAVKFQMFDHRLLGKPELAKYQMSYNRLSDLRAFTLSQGLEFICTPFDVAALGKLVKMGVKRMKLASRAIFDAELLAAANDCGLPVILSTGMASLAEVEAAVDQLPKVADLTLLHCVSAYPAPLHALNLRAMQALRENFGGRVGYSDHSAYPLALIAAATLGAEVIEAHITLDAEAEGPDHKASYTPKMLRDVMPALRAIPQMLGTGVKIPQPSELPAREVWAA